MRFSILWILVVCSCGNRNNKNEGKESANSKSVCNCGRIGMDVNLLPIAGIADSIVLCKSGTINGETWDSFLSHNKFHSNDEIINCKTHESISTIFGSYSKSISYANKALVVYSNGSFPYFDSAMNAWNSIVIDVYKEVIYAEMGVVKKSKAELVFVPIRYNRQSISETDKRYIKKLEHPHSMNISSHLLLAALSGDSLSRRRLQSFGDVFPGDVESESSKMYMEILLLLEARAGKGESMKYLDNSNYPILRNYR